MATISRRGFLGWTGLVGYGSYVALKPVPRPGKPPKPTTTIAATTTTQPPSGRVFPAVFPAVF